MAARAALRLIAVLLCLAGLPLRVPASQSTATIGKWAEQLGDELWQLGQSITKSEEIKNRYTAMNARVELKNGTELLASAVRSVERMMSRKVDAVRCILEKAEKIAEQFNINSTSTNFTYCSSKNSIQNHLEDLEMTTTTTTTTTTTPRPGDRFKRKIKEKMEPPPDCNTEINGAIFLDDFVANESTVSLVDVVSEELEELQAKHYCQVMLNDDTHFDNFAVNTNFSCVHVPTNIYHFEPEALETILWSDALNEVFVQNYNSDPALSWQYFGSTNGILRHYPAMHWETDPTVDTYDCRLRSWYIEAATCSKDVVILFDRSGSMHGYSNFIAKTTVRAILDTLSNNDFLNIYSYNNETHEVVDCFTQLVQATPQNLKTFKDALETLPQFEYANLTKAFNKAFELLASYRHMRQCPKAEQGCNQVIMLITDGVPNNMTDVFDRYNRLDNGSYIPVRVFTYLVGKEVATVSDIRDIGCNNRGYFTQITTVDEVQQQVLKYINVIARPMVLHETDHPPTWTHAYLGKTEEWKKRRKFDDKQEATKLLASVAIPAFDLKINKDNTSRTAELLGVAATDVPVDDIGKLALPYKLGVNGYSFVVSNNGYLLLHPDLRPTFNGTLKENYNSIDLVEVELFDDGFGSRHHGKQVLQLRRAMVDHKAGQMPNISIRFHYDNMRRVSRERQDFYFAPIAGTPFSLGLALPRDYGNTWIKVGDEVLQNQRLGVNIEEFFQGNNWKVHPQWVYCKYHYLEGHEFETSEDELLHFLNKMRQPNWKWSEQYEQDVTENETAEPNVNCGRKSLNDSAYYCNTELVQLLVYDAKLTDPFYKHKQFSQEELAHFAEYSATLRFVATMSGLTRWQYLSDEDEQKDSTQEFGDDHATAADETWYKSAILQHQISPKSFVFSIPLDRPTNIEDINVTASFAIFPRDGISEAPGSVVGYQFKYSRLWKKFEEITSTVDCNDCIHFCTDSDWHCYLVDHSGYVVLSENSGQIGTFFGLLYGSVMDSMIKEDIFDNVTIYDYQGVCAYSVIFGSSSATRFIVTPFSVLKKILSWFTAKIIWLIMEIQFNQLWSTSILYAQEDVLLDDYSDDYDITGYMTHNKTALPKKMTQEEEEREYFKRPQLPDIRNKTYPCDTERDLFVLNQKMFLLGNSVVAINMTGGEEYFAASVPRSNLLMLVVKGPEDPDLNEQGERILKRFTTVRNTAQMTEVPMRPCHKLALSNLPRRRLEGCYTYHPLEEEINMCGRSARVMISFSFLITAVSLTCLLSM